MYIQLAIPVAIYQKDEIVSIRAILGNDVEIISHSRNDVILPNDCYLVNVEYDHIDFSPFDLYLIPSVKRLNTNSDKYVAVVEGKFIKLMLDVPKENFWVRIYACKQEEVQENIQINYYGLEITEMSDVLHSYCSIFGSSLLSYHGTTISHKLNMNEPFSKQLTKKYSIDTAAETEAFKQLRSVSHDYVNAFYDITYFRNSDINQLNICGIEDNITADSVIFDISKYSPSELLVKFMNLQTGIFILTNERSSPLSVIYVQNPDYELSKNVVENLITTICLDIENVNKIG